MVVNPNDGAVLSFFAVETTDPVTDAVFVTYGGIYNDKEGNFFMSFIYSTSIYVLKINPQKEKIVFQFRYDIYPETGNEW